MRLFYSYKKAFFVLFETNYNKKKIIQNNNVHRLGIGKLLLLFDYYKKSFVRLKKLYLEWIQIRAVVSNGIVYKIMNREIWFNMRKRRKNKTLIGCNYSRLISSGKKKSSSLYIVWVVNGIKEKLLNCAQRFYYINKKYKIICLKNNKNFTC